EISNIQIKTNAQSLILKKYLEENYATDIGLDKMAEIFDMSKFQLIRMFEGAFHYTPMAYLRKYRILCSFKLLWENKSVDETAKAVGFSNGNYFSKIFKFEMGMTPTEYKLSKKNYHIEEM
ncbi:helix-turn-helix domain-containing protein, partial [Carnobacterium jeotgali]|uniref:helix-turn-helix domain-containing protein n=1 Tax=Carnobacterium jeotgali TaxID=545534 RepID=UPI003C734B1F